MTAQHDWDLAFDLTDDVVEKMTEEKWGRELLCVAASVGCMPIIRRLMASAEHKRELRSELLCPAEKTFKDTALHIAVRGGDVAAVKVLIETGHDLDSRDQNGKTTLDLATEGGNEVILKVLLGARD